MIELSVIFGLYVLVSGTIICLLVKSSREERSALEDRLMALSQPQALIMHKAYEEPEEASVGYVDEGREALLEAKESNGHVELGEE